MTLCISQCVYPYISQYDYFTACFTVDKLTNQQTLKKLYGPFEWAVNILPLSTQKFLVLILLTLERLSQHWSHKVVLNTGSLNWKSSALPQDHCSINASSFEVSINMALMGVSLLHNGNPLPFVRGGLSFLSSCQNVFLCVLCVYIHIIYVCNTKSEY